MTRALQYSPFQISGGGPLNVTKNEQTDILVSNIGCNVVHCTAHHVIVLHCRGFSGVHQNLVYIKNENLVYISKGI